MTIAWGHMGNRYSCDGVACHGMERARNARVQEGAFFQELTAGCSLVKTDRHVSSAR